MRREFVAQAALLGGGGRLNLVAQRLDLNEQPINLLLLSVHRAIQLVDHVFGEADLDFKFAEARKETLRDWRNEE